MCHAITPTRRTQPGPKCQGSIPTYWLAQGDHPLVLPRTSLVRGLVFYRISSSLVHGSQNFLGLCESNRQRASSLGRCTPPCYDGIECLAERSSAIRRRSEEQRDDALWT
jgi:hypothetical protein